MIEHAEIPGYVRPINFAGVELLLDLLHWARRLCGPIDLDSLLIVLCAADATMRPFMLDAPTAARVMKAARPPEDIRGSVSRRVIADKTGFSRETVRRKTSALVGSGHLLVDQDDRLRARYGLDDPDHLHALLQAHRAILRYFDRLEQFGVDPRGVVDDFANEVKHPG